MRVQFSICLLWMAFLPCLCAQSDTAPTDTKLPGKWEIGMDFLPFVDNFEFLPKIYEATERFKGYLILRYRVGERLKLRSRLGFRYYEAKNRPNTSPETTLLSGGPLGYHGSLGFERHIKQSRVSFFIGSEISASFFRTWEREDTKLSSTGSEYTTRTVREYYSDQYYWLSGLVGLQFQFLGHLNLSFEMSPAIGYQREHTDGSEYRDGVLYSSGGVNRKVFHADLKPLSAIHLTYQF